MALSSLTDDLLHEFKEERQLVYEQLDMIQPLCTSLRKPAAIRLLNVGVLVFCEVLCYLITIGGIAAMIYLSHIYPFTVLSSVFYNAQYRESIGIMNLTYLNIAVYGLVGLGVILFFIIARMTRRIRIKNSVLALAGKDMKIIVGQHLKRKAAIDAIEQRHMDMPTFHQVMVNDVPNPGFGER